MARRFLTLRVRCRGGFPAALVLASLCLGLSDATPALAWRQQTAGSRSDGQDYARAEALDAAGNVIVAGELDNGEDGIAFFVVKLAADSGAELWRREITGSAAVTEGALAVAVDAAGDVVAAGELDLDFTVIKFSGTSGDELWRSQIDGSDSFETIEEARAVAIDAAGDVVAAGFIGNAGTGRDWIVVKYAGTSGNELWRKEFDGGDGQADQATALAVDAAGDVLAAGRLSSAATMNDFAVIKLAGAGGGELWRHRIDGSDSDDEALALALYPAGDVVAAGVVDNATTQEDFAVMRLASASGNEVWRRDIDGGLGGWLTFEKATAVAIDAAGDVIATGDLEFVNQEQDFSVLKLGALDGHEIWRRTIEGGAPAASDVGYAVAVDAAGDVMAGGRFENDSRPSFDFSVIKFSGADGDELWRQMIGGTSTVGPRLEEVRALVLDAAGDAVAAGFVDNDPGRQDFTVIKFDGATGATGSVRGTKLQLLDYAGRPEQRSLSAEMRDVAFLIPPPGSADDPTIAGAEVRVINPVTHEVATFDLPPGPNWRGSGSPPGSTGYNYSDKGSNGPCTLLQVRPHDRMKVSCSGKRGAIPFTLDEASQGSLAVTIRFGSGPLQCALYGGRIRKDSGVASPGPRGTFQAVAAAPPLGLACP